MELWRRYATYVICVLCTILAYAIIGNAIYCVAHHYGHDVFFFVFANPALYLAYTVALVSSVVIAEAIAIIKALISRLRTDQVRVTLVVTRGTESMGTIAAVFGGVVLVTTLGIAQLVVPYLSKCARQHSFAIVIIQMAAWAYHFSRNSTFRNWLIRTSQKIRVER